MNGEPFLLDTNIIIGVLNGEDGLKTRFSEEFQFFVPTIVLGELCYGAFNSAWIKSNKTKIETFMNRVAMLNPDEKAA